MNFKRKLSLIAIMPIALLGLNGCVAAKVAGKAVTLPVKGVYATGKYATKGTIGAVKMTGQGVFKTGQTVVKISDGALNTTAKTLAITTQVVDLSGKVITLSKTIGIDELDSHIDAAKASQKVLSIFVDAVK